MSDKPKKMGRPKIEIDEKLFDTAIQLPIIKSDIAALLMCSEDKIEHYVKERFGITYSALKEQKGQTFRKNILGKQYELAMKGNVALLIWLGKQHLGQSDKQETKEQSTQTINLNVKEVNDILVEHKELIGKVHKKQ